MDGTPYQMFLAALFLFLCIPVQYYTNKWINK